MTKNMIADFESGIVFERGMAQIERSAQQALAIARNQMEPLLDAGDHLVERHDALEDGDRSNMQRAVGRFAVQERRVLPRESRSQPGRRSVFLGHDSQILPAKRQHTPPLPTSNPSPTGLKPTMRLKASRRQRLQRWIIAAPVCQSSTYSGNPPDWGAESSGPGRLAHGIERQEPGRRPLSKNDYAQRRQRHQHSPDGVQRGRPR